MDLHGTVGAERPVVGMVHSPALPGAPGFGGDRGPSVSGRSVTQGRWRRAASMTTRVDAV